MKAIATFETTVQVSEDSWRVIRHNLEIDGNTTIEQIHTWASKKPGAPQIAGEIRFQICPLDSMPHLNRETL